MLLDTAQSASNMDYLIPGGGGLVGAVGGVSITWYFLRSKVRDTVNEMFSVHKEQVARQLSDFEQKHNKLDGHVERLRDDVRKGFLELRESLRPLQSAVDATRGSVIRLEEREKMRTELNDQRRRATD